MKLIVKMKFGSHLYGTATPNSDVDLKGVFLPAKKDILLGRIPQSLSFATGDDVSRNAPHDIDFDIYSLHYFIKLACDGQTVALDMLHAPKEMILEASPVWYKIVDARARFYTKNLHTFISYARRQAAKYGIKGSRLNAASSMLDLLQSYNSEDRLRILWDKLPHGPFCGYARTDPNGLRQYQVCGKLFQETASIGYVIPILEKFCDEYGHRARLAAENKSIDWKAVSHALRACMQVKEILTLKTIRFPLEGAPFLMAVKEGRLDYLQQVAPVLETLMDEVEALVLHSSLPAKVDVPFWETFICQTLEKEVFFKPGGMGA
jgi:hypothetical protein